LTALEVSNRKVGFDKAYQRLIFLLEARAKELWGVARRKSKRKQQLARKEERPFNQGLVTPYRPEAIVIYA